MKFTVFLLAFAFLFMSFISRSEPQTDEHKIDRELEKCMEENGSNLGMRQCLHEAFLAWDVELNRIYKLVRNNNGEDGKAALKSSQLAWLSYRDKEYKFLENQYKDKDGSMYPGMLIGDKIQVVRNRVLILQSYFDMAEY